MAELSGAQWCERYPTDKTLGGLIEPFRAHVAKFISLLQRAGVSVRINATRRPYERAWLMRCAWDIDQEGMDPLAIPMMPPLRSEPVIQWWHGNLPASRAGASAMVKGYSLVVRPSLTSRHIDGRAIDLSIHWLGAVVVKDGDKILAVLDSSKGTENNPDLHALGALLGVRKLLSDPPHWSEDGH